MLVVGNPPAVGRPGIVGDLVVFPVIHFNLLLVVDVRVPEAEVFVGPGQFLAVGRPRRSELETFVATGNQLPS